MNEKEYKVKSEKLDCIANALLDMGYPVDYEDETTVIFKVDYGYIILEYGDLEQEDSIEIMVSEH